MKKFLTILLVVIFVLCYPCACSNTNTKTENSDIALTLENYKQYLNISAKIYPNDEGIYLKEVDVFAHHNIKGVVTVIGKPYYEFVDVCIKVSIFNEIRKQLGYEGPLIEIPLFFIDKNGNGTGTKAINLWPDALINDIITDEYTSYTVTYISGKVKSINS